jgi:hydrogenase maturation protease
MRGKRILVVGVGNDYRGDDGVGRWIARQLRNRGRPEMEVLESDGDGAALLQAWTEYDTVVLIDAVLSGAEAGAVRRFDASEQPLPPELSPRFSTHTFGVAEAIRMGAVLQQLPRRLLVIGIEGRRFEIGSDFSPEVLRAAQEVVADLCEGWMLLPAQAPNTWRRK